MLVVDDDTLFQAVNLAVGPVSRSRFRKDRDAVLESAVLFLSWKNSRTLKVWAPPLKEIAQRLAERSGPSNAL